ncbi:GNAT family N-acetyltransferase [Litorilituus lipolyticus]|uniref:N-acetyltransferase n=1 Tax=Litorilituus lipolyticus TaxID=2491017 RepID=A0A502L0X8_9GAMM|nr:GNAT family N-acetyltransferase [Litorilituus lipolyticus]TPH16459.1 N-acetyltransferase [Litorilituus lipolyticus]
MKAMETDRLIIRELNLFDAKFILTLLNEKSFIKNIGDKQVRTLADAEKYLLEGPMASYKKHGFGLLHIALKETFEPVGMCGILKRDEFELPDLGYALLPKFWRKGYAKETCEFLLNYSKNTLKIQEISAVTSPENLASNNLLAFLGFKQLSTINLNDLPTFYFEKTLG